MTTEWSQIELGDVIDIKHGFAFKGKFFTSEPGPIVVTPGNFHDQGGFKLKQPEKYYAGAIPEDFVLSTGDLLVAMTEQKLGLLGSAGLIPSSGTFLHNQRLGLVRETEPGKVSLRFVYYLFNSTYVRDQIQATASGVKVRHTSPSRLEAVRVVLPPLPVQQKIVAVLAAYDELIENNLRRIEILEEMAQAVYREWFVNFRFPGHENIDLVDSSLGPHPEGWDIHRLDTFIEFHRGRSYRSVNLLQEGGLPFLNLKCIDRGGGFRRSGIKRYEGQFKEHQIARKGDIVMALTDMTQERRIVARAARVPDIGEPEAVMSMDLLRAAPRDPKDSLFTYAMLRFSKFPDEVKQFANGANVLHLSPDRIAEYRLALPPASVRRAFFDVIAPTFELSDNLELQNVNLRRTRDLLLPKLVSGDIDVSDLNIDTEWLVA